MRNNLRLFFHYTFDFPRQEDFKDAVDNVLKGFVVAVTKLNVHQSDACFILIVLLTGFGKSPIF